MTFEDSSDLPLHDDRRQHQRFRVRVPLYISLEDDVYNKMVRLQALDISAGGVAFETSKRLPIDSRARLVLGKLGDLPRSAHIEGTVNNLRKLGEGRYRVGVQFTRFVDVDPDALLERIRVQEREERQREEESRDGIQRYLWEAVGG